MQNNTCHGQCYLAKKLKQQQEKEQESFKVHFQEAVNISPITFIFSITKLTETEKSEFSLYSSNLNPKSFNKILFRPPLA